MVNTNVLSSDVYVKLLKDIRKLICDGRAHAETAVRRELISTYWNVGKRLAKEKISNNTGYFVSILQDLSNSLEMDVSTLKRNLQFYQTYPKLKEIPPLQWSQYKLLLPISNEKKRKFYEDLAQKNNLNCRDLNNAIKNEKFEMIKLKTPSNKKKQILRPTEHTYIYKAVVERVIDGDTLLIRLDLGFQVWREQRLRLAHIDTPAMDKPGGKEAYQYVCDALAEVDFIMVKTNKIDIYGRYVGHIFYAPKEKTKEKVFLNGHYLNQELLEHNLADVY